MAKKLVNEILDLLDSDKPKKKKLANQVLDALKMNKENPQFLNIANDIINSEFEKRNIELQNNIESIADKEASRGFSLPTGIMIHSINQTYVDELQPRFKFIWDTAIKIIESHPDEISILTEKINYHSKQQHEFIKEIIENIRNKHKSGSPQYESTESSLKDLDQEYYRLIKYYKAEIKLIEAKHTHQAIKNESKLKQLICNPLSIAIIGGLIVGAILIFVFQPWQQSIQEKKLKPKEVQQSQQPNK